MKDRGF